MLYLGFFLLQGLFSELTLISLSLLSGMAVTRAWGI